jgi:hypothetical protein
LCFCKQKLRTQFAGGFVIHTKSIKMARPKKDILKQKTIVIAFRVSQSEYVIIGNNAETIGLSTAEYIRRKCTGKSLPKKKVDPLDRKLFVELSRMGNNLNQLAKVSNSGIRDPFSIHKQLEELKILLQQLKSNIANNDR